MGGWLSSERSAWAAVVLLARGAGRLISAEIPLPSLARKALAAGNRKPLVLMAGARPMGSETTRGGAKPSIAVRTVVWIGRVKAPCRPAARDSTGRASSAAGIVTMLSSG